jgi:hypothetical protein
VQRHHRHSFPPINPVGTKCQERLNSVAPKDQPGKVFDLTLPLEQVAEGERAMDERRAIKTLLLPKGGAWLEAEGDDLSVSKVVRTKILVTLQYFVS